MDLRMRQIKNGCEDDLFIGQGYYINEKNT